MLRIKVANDITRGFQIGDTLPWHGQVSHGVENAPNQFWQLLGEAERLSAQCPAIRLKDEGRASDGHRLISLNLGREGAPAFLFTGSLHGWEWEAPYGLLRLAELLGANPGIEGLPADGYFLKILPVANPYAYQHDVRQNAHGVDLNRNFDCAWAQQESREDLPIPWDFDHKGPSAASEPETRLLQGLFDRHRFLATVDFHTANFAWELAHPCDAALATRTHEAVTRRTTSPRRAKTTTGCFACWPSATCRKPTLISSSAQPTSRSSRRG